MGGGSLVAGKVGYAVSCVVAVALLAVSGVAYHFVNLSQQIGGGIDLGSGPMIGAQNVLVMGLESRTDYQGHTLSAGLLAAMHAGSVYGVNNLGVGGQATNTLILIHIFDGGQKAVGFSIPRDDWVTYPQPYDGQSAGKIDQAYGLAYAESLGKTVNTSMSSDQRYLEANQAGQAATVATVEQVTGQKINHFAEVNLAGFYYLAQSFGGITVCVKSVNARPEPARHQLRLQRGARRLQHEEGRVAVPAPEGASGPRVRQGAGQPAQRRPGPDAPPAGGHRLRDLEAEERRHPR